MITPNGSEGFGQLDRRASGALSADRHQVPEQPDGSGVGQAGVETPVKQREMHTQADSETDNLQGEDANGYPSRLHLLLGALVTLPALSVGMKRLAFPSSPMKAATSYSLSAQLYSSMRLGRSEAALVTYAGLIMYSAPCRCTGASCVHQSTCVAQSGERRGPIISGPNVLEDDSLDSALNVGECVTSICNQAIAGF